MAQSLSRHFFWWATPNSSRSLAGNPCSIGRHWQIVWLPTATLGQWFDSADHLGTQCHCVNQSRDSCYHVAFYSHQGRGKPLTSCLHWCAQCHSHTINQPYLQRTHWKKLDLTLRWPQAVWKQISWQLACALQTTLPSSWLGDRNDYRWAKQHTICLSQDAHKDKTEYAQADNDTQMIGLRSQ